MASKTATVIARMDPEVKESAELILEQLGISASSAVDMFYRQIILNNGIPFPITLKKPFLCRGDLSDEEVHGMMQQGVEDFENGRYLSVDEAESQIRRKYGFSKL